MAGQTAHRQTARGYHHRPAGTKGLYPYYHDDPGESGCQSACLAVQEMTIVLRLFRKLGNSLIQIFLLGGSMKSLIIAVISVLTLFIQSATAAEVSFKEK